MSADEWNEKYPVGTAVRAAPGLPADQGGAVIRTRTRSLAWLLGGHTPVVMVEGYPGGIALTHVEPVADQERVDQLANVLAGHLPTVDAEVAELATTLARVAIEHLEGERR